MFYKELFSSQRKNALPGTTIKIEIGKLLAGSREIIMAGYHNSNVSMLKNMTYEKLNQQVEDLLRENSYY